MTAKSKSRIAIETMESYYFVLQLLTSVGRMSISQEIPS